MKQELQDNLVKKYPKIFSEVGSTPQQSCMAFGICVDDGWGWLLDELCRELQFDTDNNNEPQIVATQVKEKFGGLRFYVNSATDGQYGAINLAEAMSMSICEQCGTTQDVSQTKTGWIKTLCVKCQKKEV